MSELVTLELPSVVIEQARVLASRSNRRIEEILSDWLDRFVADLPVGSLSDDDVLALCDMEMDEHQQDELSDLLDQQREGQLTAAGHERLDQLMTIYRRGLVRKAEALKIAVERGLRPPLG